MSQSHTGQSRYPDNWDSLRKRVYKRDGHTCQQCGGGGELHAHHITPLSKGGSNDPSNLVTLCVGCHSAVHGRPVGSAAIAASQPTGRDWKWGGPLDHLAVGVLTAGLGNIPYALGCRLGSVFSRSRTRKRD